MTTFMRDTCPWWSAPQISMTLSNLRVNELVVVIGDIRGKIGRRAVAPDQDVVPVIPHGRGGEPGGVLPFGDIVRRP